MSFSNPESLEEEVLLNIHCFEEEIFLTFAALGLDDFKVSDHSRDLTRALVQQTRQIFKKWKEKTEPKDS